ncbi:Uma2 family endonuclease [Synechococcus sp. F70.1]|jgi:Uma2 family endonuclease|uniref:Uma2 family endonuclease n=1 Tax=Synechococcus sp. F70.1 TaxID=2964532 RepID=UPI0039C5B928
MGVAIPLQAISLQEGSRVVIHSLTWQDCESILEELGEDRHTRIAYYDGTFEIMSPLSKHERLHRIASDIVKALLDAQGRDWEDFGSTTLKKPGRAGVEPDTCFYVNHLELVRGCEGRIDVDQLPPPDLAIESDVTSRTFIEAYRAIGVPEVWILGERSLRIFILQGEDYVESSCSWLFPDFDIPNLVPQLIRRALEIGTSAMLREFRETLRNS